MSPRDIFLDTFRALRVRNYRLFTTAQLISMSGTWMQTVAQNWLVLRLTESGIALGVTIGLQFLPTAIGGLWAGLIADRFDKRKILIGTQTGAGVLAVVLGMLTVTGVVHLWMVYVLALALGIVTAVDTPARQSFVIELVGQDEIANAVGLNSAVFNASRIVGPALAGVVIATVGLAPAFFANAVSYIAPVVALMAMDTRALHRTERARREPGMLRSGLAYAWKTPEIRRTIALLAVVATLGFNFMVTVPMLAKFTFHRDAAGYAWLSSIGAGGGLIGALWTARRARPSARLLIGSAATFGVFAIAAAFSPSIWWAAGLLAITSAAAMAFISTANTTLQLVAPSHLRGRIMALYALVFLGSTPIGGPLVGWIGQQFGARASIGVGGVATLIAAAIAWFTSHGRRTRLRAPQDATEPTERIVEPQTA